MPWLLDVVFAMAGRVRPYNKYLPWELRTHPLEGWPADELLGLVERSLDGDADALRETFARVRAACAAYDERRGHTLTTDMVDGWGDQLAVLEGRGLAHDEPVAEAGRTRRGPTGRWRTAGPRCGARCR